MPRGVFPRPDIIALPIALPDPVSHTYAPHYSPSLSCVVMNFSPGRSWMADYYRHIMHR